MKSYWLRAGGGATVLEERNVPTPEPGPGQLLVQMKAAGLNRGEFLARAQLHGSSPAAKPSGNEGAGVVAKVGPNASGFSVGDRVMGVCAGAFSEFALMDAPTTMAVPERLNWIAAAVTPLIFLLVYDVLIAKGRLKPGEWVLVLGASSGVGVGVIQAAKALGARVIGTSGSAEKLEKLRDLGLDVAVRTREPHFFDAVMKATQNKGADVAVNAVGPSLFAEILRSLAFEGRFAVVGYVDGQTESTIDVARLHANRLTVYGASALLRTPEQRTQTVRGFVAELLPFIADGTITPVVDSVFPFSDVSNAKAYMETNKHLGKIAVTIAN